jgi:hypothetical protein
VDGPDPGADYGKAGPARTPASRGQATPTTKHTTAIMPILIQEGRSASCDGILTTVGSLASRDAMEQPFITHCRANAKTWRNDDAV